MKRKKEENEFFPLHPYYLIIDSEQNLGFVSQSVGGGKKPIVKNQSDEKARDGWKTNHVGWNGCEKIYTEA